MVTPTQDAYIPAAILENQGVEQMRESRRIAERGRKAVLTLVTDEDFLS